MSPRHDKCFTLEARGHQSLRENPTHGNPYLVENGLTHGYAGKDEGVFILSRSEAEV